MPYRLKQVLQALKSQQGVKACGGTLTTPPPMPKKLPPLIKLLTKNVPRTQRDCPHVFFRGGSGVYLKEKNPNNFGFSIDLHYLCRQQTI